MRPSTAEGWYVLSIIAVSFRRFRGRKPATPTLSTPAAEWAHRPEPIAREAGHLPNYPSSSHPLHHALGGGGLREPGHGAGDRFAFAADRRRFRHDRRRSLDRGRRLFGESR